MTTTGYIATVRDRDGDTFTLRLPFASEAEIKAHADKHGLDLIAVDGTPLAVREIPESARRDEKSAMTWAVIGLLFAPAMIPAVVLGSRAKEASGGRLGSVALAIAGFGIVVWIVGAFVFVANAQ